MASIDCVVDTNPMASELSSVSRHVTGTTAAVVAMKAAVLKAESDAANHIVANVNRGFYSLIHSQISQKIAKLTADVDSWVMKLSQQRRQLLEIRNRMERDYMMLTARYTKLFNRLNRNLLDRIYALDKPVIDFAGKEMDRENNRPAQLTAIVPTMQKEFLSASQRLLMSSLKHRGSQAILSMDSYLKALAEQDALSARILLPKPLKADSQKVMAPVMIMEMNFDNSGAKVMKIFSDEELVPNRHSETIRQAQKRMAWTAPQYATQDLIGDFNGLLASSSASDRVKRTAYQLFTATAFSTLSDSQS
ncbi:MAG: hypothetical protein NC102_08400 [Clostridium sp.]|nr:hypothetical protein [Clostridium sp.]